VYLKLQTFWRLPSKLSTTTIQTLASTQGQETRGRFNSLDSGLLLSRPYAQVNNNANNNNTNSIRMRGASTSAVSTLMSAGSACLHRHEHRGYARSAPYVEWVFLAPPSSTSGGFLASPPTSGANMSQGQGSIAP